MQNMLVRHLTSVARACSDLVALRLRSHRALVTPSSPTGHFYRSGSAAKNPRSVPSTHLTKTTRDFRRARMAQPAGARTQIQSLSNPSNAALEWQAGGVRGGKVEIRWRPVHSGGIFGVAPSSSNARRPSRKARDYSKLFYSRRI